MGKLRLPDFFGEMLTGNPLEGPVLTSLERCGEFFSERDRNLPFFPEYTDHGCAHVQGVLDSAAELITPEAKLILTPEDVGVLVASILLHDSAMHLTQDSFLQMIKPPASPSIIPSIDKLTWPDQWDEYLSEAKRWDGRKLHRVPRPAHIKRAVGKGLG